MGQLQLLSFVPVVLVVFQTGPGTFQKSVWTFVDRAFAIVRLTLLLAESSDDWVSQSFLLLRLTVAILPVLKLVLYLGCERLQGLVLLLG